MTTAEALEGLPDAGKFEVLATRVLRELYDDCRAIAHFGVNASGKTIRNPVDGFSLVPGSNPPRYVMTAFTTTPRNSLERKWLFDHTVAPKGKKAAATEDGDLIKAGREAADVLASHPAATFVVYLCTNRRLDSDLMKRVYDKAAELRVEVRFLEQSQLRDFLDMKPEGQWLRQEHLGIAADQVSQSLLQHLSRFSLDRCMAELILTSVDLIIPTRAADVAAAAIHSADTSLHLLVGPSGVGKSVIGQDILRRHLANGGIGMWIPGETVERATSLTDAVETVLRSLHPRMNSEAGHETLRQASPDRPLLLVVDDINRANEPTQLLQKVIVWSRPPSQVGSQDGTSKSPIHVICPVWDSYWLPLRHIYERVGWVRVQAVGPMSRMEAITCLRAALHGQADRSNAELDTFAARLSDDPILLGLFGRILRDEPNTDPVTLSEDVIGHFSARAVGELTGRHGRVGADYESALSRLSSQLIRRKVLYPHWADLESWFQVEPRVLDALSQLAAQGHICRLTERDGNCRFEFRHDRILEHHLTRAVDEMVRQAGDQREWVRDPFFTPLMGRVVGRFPLTEPVLEWVSEKTPGSLIAAIPHLPPPPSDYAAQVVSRAREWLVRAETSPKSERLDACWTLAATTSPYVLEVTDGAQGYPWLLEARLQNGDAMAGAKALSREFTPAVRNSWLEALIEQTRSHHGPALVEKLRSLMTADDLDDRLRSGALCLAGYLGDSGLAAAVKTAWENATDRLEILLPALWAGLRCGADRPADVLGPMIPAILELPHDASGHSISKRGSVLEDLGFAIRHGISEPVLRYLTDLGMAEEPCRWIAAAVLDDVDHPLAIRYVTHVLADAKHRAEQAGAFSPWAMHWGDRWKGRQGGIDGRLSAASIAELRSLWEDESQPRWLREYAFSRWCRYVATLDELRSIPTGSPHFQAAAWQRALQGDPHIVPYVLAKLSADRWWFHVVPPIWCQEFIPAVDSALATFATELRRPASERSKTLYEPSYLLRDIPTELAEGLIEKYWEDLRQVPCFIQAALYHGTEKCRAFAAESLGTTHPGGEALRHVGSFFGFFTQGLVDRLTVRHLETLRPYLDRLDDHCIDDMVEFCHRYDHWNWALQHLRPECRQRAQIAEPHPSEDQPFIVRVTRRWFPSDEELLADLDEIEKRDSRYYAGALHFWWERFLERRDSSRRPPRVLERWLQRAPSLTRFKVAACALRERGTRQDLAMLRNCNFDPKPAEVEPILADVEFAVMRRSLD
jgi:hypothetical protein